MSWLAAGPDPSSPGPGSLGPSDLSPGAGSARRRIRLASASPRRRQLLEDACFVVDVAPVAVDESWPGGPPARAVLDIARRKLDRAAPASIPVLAADTVVLLGDQPLGKPASPAEAEAMLARLAGRTHTVITGFCLRCEGGVSEQAVATLVTFRSLSADQIRRYVATGEPMDKAGAYGIQGRGGALVDHVDGSYTNVVGLPLAEVIALYDRECKS